MEIRLHSDPVFLITIIGRMVTWVSSTTVSCGFLVLLRLHYDSFIAVHGGIVGHAKRMAELLGLLVGFPGPVRS